MKFGSVLTIDELADYLQVPKSTLYKLAQEEKIPGRKVGRHWRFRRDVIDRWLENGGAENPAGEGSEE
ncbi:MAG: helix-turn-helix domain-containing protein [Armatimonadetes bacterium]|nr:helix-turn-helix domain-containing protein [Armatimonadota bacterium]